MRVKIIFKRKLCGPSITQQTHLNILNTTFFFRHKSCGHPSILIQTAKIWCLWEFEINEIDSHDHKKKKENSL